MSTDVQPMKPTARSDWKRWAVGIVALLWNAMGAFDYLMTQTKNADYMANFTPEQLEYFYGFPAWMVAAWALAVWGGVLGAVLLLMRKRLAEHVFLVSFLAMVLTTFYSYVLSNGMELFGGAGSHVFSALIFVVALGLYLYARHLRKRGVLA
ncbi:MAG TPA: hypothetical protein VFI92_00210 [Steroidobacteraceae bacterium]|nr:hypothetical protein [Steroidobacteraceae bacterium]